MLGSFPFDQSHIEHDSDSITCIYSRTGVALHVIVIILIHAAQESSSSGGSLWLRW